ncbi:MAG: phage tail tape measure protein [Gemmatimonadota bacterium]
MNAGEIEATITLRDQLSSQLNTIVGNLQKAGVKMDQVGQQFEKAGSLLTTRVTAPIVAASAAVFKFSADFESSMTKVVTIAGESADNLASMKKSVLELSASVAIGPKALADALIVVESTGIHGAEALDILKRSAQASATGLGETKDIARAVTAAITAYGSSNLTAAQATDVLFAAVKAGGAEADEFAGSLGRVIGISAQAGVSFQEVAGFIATFTRLGVDADEAVTALRGTLGTVLKPSKEAREALASVGSSVDELRASIKDKGLTQALIDLVTSTKGNVDTMAAIVPNVRALAGVLGTAGAQAQQMRDVLDQVSHSTGVLDAAFKTTQQTSAFTWGQLKADVEAAAIAFGDQLAPHLKDAMKALMPLKDVAIGLASAFGALPSSVQTAIIAFGALVVAIGPLSFAFGSLLRVIGAVQTALVTLATTITTGGLSSGLVGLGIAAAGIGTGFLIANGQMKEFLKNQAAINDQWKAQQDVKRLVAAGQSVPQELANRARGLKLLSPGGGIDVDLGGLSSLTPGGISSTHAGAVRVIDPDVLQALDALSVDIGRSLSSTAVLGIGSLIGKGVGGSLGAPPFDARLLLGGAVSSNANAFLSQFGSTSTGAPSSPDLSGIKGQNIDWLGLTPANSGGLGSQFASSLGSFSTSLGPTVLGAVQGGGSVSKAIGAQAINAFTPIAAHAISGALSTGLGISGSVALGVGTLGIGAAVMGGIALYKHLTDVSGRRDVEQFAGQMGGFDELHKKLGELGADGERLWVKLTQGTGQGNSKQAKENIDAITMALSKAGNAAKDAQDAFGKIQSNFATAQGLIEKYHINLDNVGHSYQQLKTSASALDLAKDIKSWVDAGLDLNDILNGTKDAFEAVVLDAIKNQTVLPDSIKPYLQTLVNWGLLLDENGEAMTDLSKLNFAPTMADTMLALNDTLKTLNETLKLIGLTSGEVAKQIQQNFNKIHIPSFSIQDPGSPGFGEDPAVAGGRSSGPALVADIPVSSVTRAGMAFVKPGDIIGMPGRGGGLGSTVVVNVSAIDAASFEDWGRRGGARMIAGMVAEYAQRNRLA